MSQAIQEMIYALISDTAEALTAAEIRARFSAATTTTMADRTLRRHLAALVAEGKVTTSGARRTRKYAAVPPAATPDQASPGARTDDPFPPLSDAGIEALALVRRHRSQRSPVGYNADFLMRYGAGQAPYLTAADLETLKAWGATSDLTEAAGTFAREIAARLLIDLSWASSRLEGNTYSLLDTERLLEHGQQAEGKDVEETQMILNHKRAIEFLVENAADIAFNRYTMFSLHAILAENLLADQRDEGRLRSREVGIGGSTYVPLAIPQKLEEYFDVILEKLEAIGNPFEQSFFAMVHLPYLQPFIDVNKRTSRLAANIPLIKGNLVPLSFLDVSRDAYTQGLLAIYENNDVSLLKDVFMWAYERSSRQYRVVREAVGEPDPFRQKHREKIHAAVKEVILMKLAPTVTGITHWAHMLAMPEDDRERFARMIISLLDGVREDNAGRYRVTPAQYRAWRTLSL